MNQPFNRRTMRIIEPVRPISQEYHELTGRWTIKYHIGKHLKPEKLLENQFKLGQPLKINGKNLVIEMARVCYEAGLHSELEVIAIDVAQALELLRTPQAPVQPGTIRPAASLSDIVPNATKPAPLVPVSKGVLRFPAPEGRKIFR